MPDSFNLLLDSLDGHLNIEIDVSDSSNPEKRFEEFCHRLSAPGSSVSSAENLTIQRFVADSDRLSQLTADAKLWGFPFVSKSQPASNSDLKINWARQRAADFGLSADSTRKIGAAVYLDSNQLIVSTASHTGSSCALIRGNFTEPGAAARALPTILTGMLQLDPEPPFSANASIQIWECLAAPPQIQSLLMGQRPFVLSRASEQDRTKSWPNFGETKDLPSGTILISGSFRPLHRGHLEMANWIEQKTNSNVLFEMPLINADKPILDHFEIRERSVQNFARHGLLLSMAPTFAEKARIFPAAAFAVGADTLARIGDLRFYQNDATQFTKALQTIVENDCRFWVFGRKMDQHFVTANEMSLPEDLLELCTSIDENEFRVDISSTQVRNRQ